MSATIEARLVNPFYLSLLNGNFVEEDANIATRAAEAARAASDLEIERLLAKPDWRGRLCAAWFIGLSRRAHFVPRIGDLLARDTTYAGQGYCAALGLIGTQECVGHLNFYLESGREDLRSWVIDALAQIEGATLAGAGSQHAGDRTFCGIVAFLRDHQIISRPDLAAMSDVEAICREIYAETRAHYDAVRSVLGSAALGFRVLYGPPVVGAPYVFLGFQPGGTKDESDEGQHNSWPDQSWYTTSNAPLARQLRYVFGIDTVKHSGLNMVFFRAPRLTAWDRIEPSVKAELERFSLERVERLVAALAPQHLIVIGLRTFRQLAHGDGDTVLRGKRDNRLVAQGTFGGCLTSGIVHLSGARVSGEDRKLLREYFNPGILS